MNLDRYDFTGLSQAKQQIPQYQIMMDPEEHELLETASDCDKERTKRIYTTLFKKGDDLLKSVFQSTHFNSLDPAQREYFADRKESAIIQNLQKQGTLTEPYQGSSVHIITGGTSRLGRTAVGLKKMGVIILLEMKHLLERNCEAQYSQKRRAVSVGLEEGLYPNQISFNLLHEIGHAFHDNKCLVIPSIQEKAYSLYPKLTLDELIVYRRNILYLTWDAARHLNILTAQSSHAKRTLVAMYKLYREFSIRILRKKHSLLEALNHIAEIESNPSTLVLNSEDDEVKIRCPDPQIIFYKGSFLRGFLSKNTQETPSENNTFKEENDSYLECIRTQATYTRYLIKDALYFAEECFRSNR